MTENNSTASAIRPDTAQILGGLKDFQRTTVEHVFRRLYLDDDCTRRFLVADEVGLGKTLIARGVIAKAIDHLWDKTQRIDIVYVCSNTDIARQNINRLNVTKRKDFHLASRITLLPMTAGAMERNKVNFISFTPGTSFELSGSSGTTEERELLYWLLKEPWSLSFNSATRVLHAYSSVDRFRTRVTQFTQEKIQPELQEAFVTALNERKDLKDAFKAICEEMPRAGASVSRELDRRRHQLIGELRNFLAQTCLRWLQPDLIILDEFQRFKYLLQREPDKERTAAAELAEFLFSFQQADGDPATAARVLLLSATPYKMYTQSQETEQDDHYADFQSTLKFLIQEPAQQATVRNRLQRYREELFRLTDRGVSELVKVKAELEATLRGVMARTEKLALKADRNGMLEVIPAELSLSPGELRQYLGLQKVARHLGHDDILEYWKSAPYLLNFMEGYSFKKKFIEAVENNADEQIAQSLTKHTPGLLDREQLDKYKRLDPANARLRSLHGDTVGHEAWRLLWIAPSLPYYLGSGPYAAPALQKFTKRLVFSCWKVVPKAIASVLSYEAERNMMRRTRKNPYTSKRRSGLLQFRLKSGQPSGMAILSLVYPCRFLAERIDPLKYLSSRDDAGRSLTSDVILSQLRTELDELLRPLIAQHSSPNEVADDDNWYWAAPLLLDLKFHEVETRTWFGRPDLATVWRHGTQLGMQEAPTGWSQHLEQAQALITDKLRLGTPPENLSQIIARSALAAPGTASLRAIQRILPKGECVENGGLAAAAGQLGHAFLHLFNLPEVMHMLRARTREVPYWQSVLDYCVSGNLQSVLDEYAHLLLESQGLTDRTPTEIASGVSNAMIQALSLNTSTAKADIINTEGRRVRMQSGDEIRLRNRFAMRFGDQDKDAGSSQQTRADHVRSAFNSPFWPFVLATTSVGQEGLDFHPYCHAVVHWNLPSNPVDLEQREGRVHRYKGHALRKNIAMAFGTAAQNGTRNPWESMFSHAKASRAERENDLYPYWIAPQGEARIQRHVPAFPHSRDKLQQANLSRSLVLYRMVFGQNRQDDLVEYLLAKHAPEEVERIVDQCRIDLTPPVTSDSSDRA